MADSTRLGSMTCVTSPPWRADDPGATSSDLAVMDVRNQVATYGETIVRAGIAGRRPVANRVPTGAQGAPPESARSRVTIRNGLLDLELTISHARNTLARTTSRRMKVKDLGRSRRRRGNQRNGNVQEVPFLWTRSRAVFMQWLNPGCRCYRRDGGRGLSSDAPADRDVHERRAKFFSPEIFGPSK